MFGFANPNILYLLLLLLPAIVGLYWYSRYTRKQNIAKYGKEKQVKELMPDVSSKKHIVRLTIILLLITTVVVMLARPRAGTMEKIKDQASGIEVVIAMDVSNSMNASSTSDPNGISRLERSKMVMQKLIDRLHNDKVALVVFAGKALMQMPMTYDGTSAKMFLNSISTDLVSLQGTNINSAIDLSMKAFSKDEKVSKSIILITDAENFEGGDAVEAAKEAHDKGIQVNVIGIGEKNVPIPLEDGNYMLNDNGEIAKTHFNEEKALNIAKAGGGTLVKGDATDAMNILNETLKKLASTNMSQITFSKEDELFPIFAWIALALLIASVLLINRKNPWLAKKNFFKTKHKDSDSIAAILILVMATASSMALTGCGNDDDTYIAQETTKQERQHIKKGNSLYDDKNYEDAEIEYRKAIQANPNSVAANYNLALSLARQASAKDSTNTQELVNRADSIFNIVTTMTKDTTLLAMTYHNMGNLRYEHENYQGAIVAYKKSLMMNPSDDDTRYNLRMAQLKLQQQQQQQQQQQDKNQDKKDNKENQDQDKNQDKDSNKDQQQQKDQQDQKKEQSGNPDQANANEQPLDERNMQQILKAAQDKENSTLEKINKMQQNQQRQERRQTQNKW